MPQFAACKDLQPELPGVNHVENQTISTGSGLEKKNSTWELNCSVQWEW